MMLSFASLETRLKLILALLTKGTSGWMEELTTTMEQLGGLNYKTAKAESNPYDLYTRLFGGKVSIERVDYSGIYRHDFFAADKKLNEFWNSEPEVASFIGDVVYNNKAVNVIETGCFVGFGTAHLATALSRLGGDRNLYVVDFNKTFLDITEQNIQSLGIRDITIQYIEGVAWEENVFRAIPDNIDVMFLDSDHSYSGLKKELACYLPKLSANGVAIVHDTIMWPGARKAIYELPDGFAFSTFATCRGCGMSVVSRSNKRNMQ